MKKVVIKKIKPFSVGIFMGAFLTQFAITATIIDLIFGSDYLAKKGFSIITLITAGIKHGFLSAVLTILLYFLFGFIIGFMNANFYNQIAKYTGGLEVDLDGPGNNK